MAVVDRVFYCSFGSSGKHTMLINALLLRNYTTSKNILRSQVYFIIGVRKISIIFLCCVTCPTNVFSATSARLECLLLRIPIRLNVQFSIISSNALYIVIIFINILFHSINLSTCSLILLLCYICQINFGCKQCACAKTSRRMIGKRSLLVTLHDQVIPNVFWLPEICTGIV